MTIDEIYRLCQFIVNKEQNGNFAPGDFNLLSPRAQLSFINSRITPKVDQKTGKVRGWQTDQTIRRELSPILKPLVTTAVSSGIASKPNDYLDFDVLQTTSGKIIHEVTFDELAVLSQSLIKPPTTDYPKFAQSQSGFHIEPNTITSIKLTYLREPANPYWDYNIVSGAPVYNSGGSTVQFELPSITHNEIVVLILQPVGINLSVDDVTKYAMIKQQEGI